MVCCFIYVKSTHLSYNVQYLKVYKQSFITLNPKKGWDPRYGDDDGDAVEAGDDEEGAGEVGSGGEGVDDGPVPGHPTIPPP